VSSSSIKSTVVPTAEYDPDFTEGRTLNRKDVALGQRGDIIEFYNKIYINYIKDFALKFQSTDEVRSCELNKIHSFIFTSGMQYQYCYCTQKGYGEHKANPIVLALFFVLSVFHLTLHYGHDQRSEQQLNFDIAAALWCVIVKSH